jgi:DNA-binding MarR family transcriptional regulator
VLENIDLKGTGYCASLNFRRTARAVTKLFDLAFDAGTRSTQFTILVGVAKTQPTSISALSEMLLIDRTTLSRSLRLLQKEGLLTISARAEMRQRFLSLTRKGVRELARAVPQWRKMQQRFVSEIGTEYWIRFRAELERLAGVACALEHDHLALAGAKEISGSPSGQESNEAV